ncbi:MAG: hypothetical protein JXA30_13305 [Deltaproteobacteria bacterium]|nr:hypothetical protein [Deltaproteobacteria bacterium]
MAIKQLKNMNVIWVAVAIAACSQTDPPENSEKVKPEDYYPLVDGATWTYAHSSKGGWEETVTMARSEDDSDIFVVSDTPNPDEESTESDLKRNGTSVYRISKVVFQNGEPQFSVKYDPGFLRFDAAWLEEDISHADTRNYKRIKTETGQSPEDAQDREHIFIVQSLNEKLVVRGETFRNCVRIKREKEVAIDETDSNQSDEQEKLFWFAPRVGKIREENLTTENFEELVDYDIP